MCSTADVGQISPTAQKAGGSPGSGGRRHRGIAVLVGLILLVASPPVSAQPVHHRYPIARPSAHPSGIGADDRGVWFSETEAGRIATMSGRGELVEYEIPDAGSRPYAVAASRLEGRILFTDVGLNRIGVLSSAARFTWIAIPTRDSQPLGITLDYYGSVWFTEHAADRIGLATPFETMAQEFVLPAGSAPYGICGGPDQRVWFTEYGSNRIGSIDRIGARGEFAIPTPDSGPTSIALGSDGAMWFTESRANRIGRITALGEVQEFEIPTPDSEPAGLVATFGGFWFAERATGRIGFVALDGSIREYALPDGSEAATAAFDGGSVWYLDPAANAVGRVSGNALYPVGAGTVGTWDTRFTVSARDEGPTSARIGSPFYGGTCPGQCFDPAVTLDLSSGEPQTVVASRIPYAGGLDLLMIGDGTGANPAIGQFGALPAAEARVVNSARPEQAGRLPLVDHWTVADAEPPAAGRARGTPQPRLRFAAQRRPGIHANLIVTVIEREESGRESFLLEAVTDGRVVASHALTGCCTFFLVDVLDDLGLADFDGELRVTRQSARALFWGVLASVRIDGVDFVAPTAETSPESRLETE